MCNTKIMKKSLLFCVYQITVNYAYPMAAQDVGAIGVLRAGGNVGIHAIQATAELGGPIGQCDLGWHYMNAGNYIGAIPLFRMAADQGVAQAYYNLGWCYQHGLGIGKNADQAFLCYEQAAGQGLKEAQCMLGECYESGFGVRQDIGQAFNWYFRAAREGAPGSRYPHGYAQAQYNLGLCFANGEGVPGQDMGSALNWYRRAARQGHAGAQFALGWCYHSGEGVEMNAQEAVRWYRASADQGYAPAQYNLALCYQNGFGVDRDEEEAIRLCRLAANQGLAEAQNALRPGWREWLRQWAAPIGVASLLIAMDVVQAVTTQGGADGAGRA